MKRSAPTTALVLFFTAVAGLAEVVVLKGGVIIPLQRPPVRRGNNVLLTRTDGTLLSVPASEIDRTATAAASSAPPPAPPASSIPARPATLAEAARAAREVPKARVRITDANVSHGEAAAAAASAEETATAQETAAAAGAGRVEVDDYSQEKSGDALVVRGTLRNPGATPVIDVRMTVTALDAKGQTITAGEAGVSNGTIAPSSTVAFSVTLPVGPRQVASLKFSPRWVAPAVAGSGSGSPGSAEPASRDRALAAAAAAPTPLAAPTAPPAPAPTPYGRGSLYAPPAPNAPSEAPKDGKTGHIPGASHPSNQPKPPN